jgi:hypothetical protein
MSTARPTFAPAQQQQQKQQQQQQQQQQQLRLLLLVCHPHKQVWQGGLRVALLGNVVRAWSGISKSGQAQP